MSTAVLAMEPLRDVSQAIKPIHKKISSSENMSKNLQYTREMQNDLSNPNVLSMHHNQLTLQRFENFLQGGQCKLLLLTPISPAQENSILEILSEGMERQSIPFNLRLTIEGVAALDKLIKNPQLAKLDLIFHSAENFQKFLGRLEGCSHINQIRFRLESSSKFSNSSNIGHQDAKNLALRFPSLKQLHLLIPCQQNISFLKTLPQLTDLKLRGAYNGYDAANADIKPLSLLTNLAQLDLSDFELRDVDFSVLSSHSNLHTLRLSNNHITKKSISSINCSSLTDVNLSNNTLENDGALEVAMHFAKLSNLRTLNLDSNYQIGNTGILALVGLTQLTNLSAAYHDMDDDGCKALIELFHMRSIGTPIETTCLRLNLWRTMPCSSARTLPNRFSNGVNNTVEIKW